MAPSPPSGGGPLPSRVLHVMNGAAGGAALSTLDLIAGLSANGIASCVVCHPAGSAAEQAALRDATEGRFEVRPLRIWNRKVRAAPWKRPLLAGRQALATGGGRRSAQAVTEAARRWDVELVHTNTVLTPEGALAAERLGLPHVWHVRELVGPGEPFRFWDERRFLRHRVERRASVLIANSAVTAATLQPFVERPVAVVHNGLDLEAALALPARPPTGRVRIGMVANLTSRWKRHDVFLRAAALARRDDDIDVWLVGHDPQLAEGPGNDPYADHLHELAGELGLPADVFRGFVTDPTEVMGSLDILVHTAADESFGRTIVEAMAAGIPVVGVRSGGVAELTEDGATGLLAEPGDVEGVARCITELVRDPERRRAMGARGREVARQRFTRAAMTDAVLAQYRLAMARPVGGPARAASAP